MTSFRRNRSTILGVAALAVAVPFLALPAGVRADEGRLSREEALSLESRLAGVAAEATKKTVCVFGVIGLGSGAVVDPAGTVVTNAHVAAGARFAVVLRSDGERLLYKRRGIDFEKDLAVLEPERPLDAAVPHFALAPALPDEGAWVAALGFPGGPRGADPRPTFTIGRVAKGGGMPNVAGVLDYSDAIRTDVPIFSGNSGGPLVDLEGRLVGINGAVDLTGDTAGLSIRTELVADRLESLKGGVIRLPGGTVLDPATNGLVARLERALDPIVRDLMERNLGRATDEADDLIGQALPLSGDPRAADRFAEKIGTAGRNRLLRGLFEREMGGRRRAIALGAGEGRTVPATPLNHREAVACASALGDPAEGATVEAADGRRFRVAARAAKHDLVLLQLDSGPDLEVHAEADAEEPAVGTLVVACGENGPLGAGVVSAPARRISARTSLLLAQSAEGGLQKRILETIGRVARLLGSDEVAELVRQLEAALEQRRGFSAGSHPRGHARVISHDAPLGPSAAGAPLVDLHGRLVGVHIATAHHGTSYAVPIATVRAAFAGVKPTGPRAPGEPRRDPAPREPF
jgi:S1-C subfamily serine protease